MPNNVSPAKGNSNAFFSILPFRFILDLLERAVRGYNRAPPRRRKCSVKLNEQFVTGSNDLAHCNGLSFSLVATNGGIRNATILINHYLSIPRDVFQLFLNDIGRSKRVYVNNCTEYRIQRRRVTATKQIGFSFRKSNRYIFPGNKSYNFHKLSAVDVLRRSPRIFLWNRNPWEEGTRGQKGPKKDTILS